jgi:hypothetical protein
MKALIGLLAIVGLGLWLAALIAFIYFVVGAWNWVFLAGGDESLKQMLGWGIITLVMFSGGKASRKGD